MADYNLGSARGEVVIKYDGTQAKEAPKDIENIEKAAGKADSSVKKSGDAANQLATGMVVLGGAAVAGMTLAVRSAMNFEDALAGVRAAGNASSAEMDKLRDKALQLGADTKFSATEAASAMEALIKAGLTTNDVLSGAADAAVNLAAAERIDLTQASEIAATAMTAFNLKASDLPKIADTISRSASATKQTVSDFAQAMNQAGAVSKLVGLSFDDMALAITAMGKAGIVGSDAGTSLKTMLMNLQPQTKQQKKLMRELGIVTKDGANQFFDATGKIKSMTDIAGVLGKALTGMSEKQKMATLETLFGSDAIRAAAIIADQGAAGMKNLTGEMGAQLSVAEKAKIQMSSFAGTMENFRGTMETAAIGLGSIFLPILDKIVKIIMAAVGWFDKLPGPVKEIAAWVIALAGSFLLLSGGFIKIFVMVEKYIELLKLVKIAQIAVLLTNPWLLIAIAVAVAIALIIIYWDEIVAYLTMIWTNLKTTAGQVWEGIKHVIVQPVIDTYNDVIGFFQKLWNFVVGVWNSLKETVAQKAREFVDNFVRPIMTGIENVKQFFRDLPGNLLGALGDLGSLLLSKGRDLIEGLIRGVTGALGKLMDKIRDIGNQISKAFSTVLSIFSPSKVFRKFGVFTMEGYVLGLDDMQKTVLNKVSGIASNVAIVGNPTPLMPSAPLGSSTRGGDGASAGGGTTIQNLHLNVSGNLDPSNPTEFRKTVKTIKKAIETVDKEMR